MALIVKPHPNVLPSHQITAPDFIVMHGGLVVGRICKREVAISPACHWIWAITAPIGAPNSVRQSGSTATHDEAKAALKDSWQQCLAWARSSGRELEVELSDPQNVQDDDPLAALVREGHDAARG
jgi:hypothetical protein